MVADGYSSAHSCQHCKQLTIIPYSLEKADQLWYWPEWRAKIVYGTSGETPIVASGEEIRQRAAAGCRLWSMVSDEVDYELLKHKRDRLPGMPKIPPRYHQPSRSSHSLVFPLNTYPAGTCGSVALSNNEIQELERLRNRCLSKYTLPTSPITHRTPAEACGYYVKLSCHVGVPPAWPAADLPIQIYACENGLEYSIGVEFTVFELPGIYPNLFLPMRSGREG